jgi:uncharacterized membrane protein
MRGELHPFVLHFAVGLLLTAPLCDVAGLVLRREPLLFAGRWMTIAGAVAALFSLLTGLGAEAALGPHSTAGEALLHLHKALGIVLAVVCVPVAGWRALSKVALPRRARTLYLAATFAAAAILTAETALGSALVYRHGVGLSPAARAEPMARTPR